MFRLSAIETSSRNEGDLIRLKFQLVWLEPRPTLWVAYAHNDFEGGLLFPSCYVKLTKAA